MSFFKLFSKTEKLKIPSNDDLFISLDKGWWQWDIQTTQQDKPIWPYLRDQHSGEEVFCFPLARDGKVSAFIHLEKPRELHFKTAAWPLEISDHDCVQIKQISGAKTLFDKIKKIFNLVFQKDIARKLFGLFKNRGTGVFNLARSVLRVYKESGLGGIYKKLKKPFHNVDEADLFPQYWWFQKYLKNHHDQYGDTPSTLNGYTLLSLPGTQTLENIESLLADVIGNDRSVDLYYGDEFIQTGETSGELALRHAFSLDRFLYRPELGGLLVVRDDLCKQLNLSAEHPLSQEDVFALVQHSSKLSHINAIVNIRHSKHIEFDFTKNQEIDRFIDNLGLSAKIDGQAAFGYDVRWPVPEDYKASIIIPTKNRHDLVQNCVESIQKTCDPKHYEIVLIDHNSDDLESLKYFDTISDQVKVIKMDGPFNFPALNEKGVEHADPNSDFYIFMNNDIEVITEDWLDRLIELAAREDSGIVGPLLSYPNDSVQHAGVVMGLWHFCDHVSKFMPIFDDQGARKPGRNYTLTHCSELSAITGACMVMRKSVYHEIGGFDTRFAVGYNDIDLCLRVKEKGYKVIYDGKSFMYHHESVSRGKSIGDPHPQDTQAFYARYEKLLTQEYQDRFYSPYYAMDSLVPIADEAKTNLMTGVDCQEVTLPWALK